MGVTASTKLGNVMEKWIVRMAPTKRIVTFRVYTFNIYLLDRFVSFLCVFAYLQKCE